MRTRVGLVVAMALTVSSAVCAVAGVDALVVRAALAVPVVLVAPGYTLLAALRVLPRLALWERVAYTVGASLALGVLAGVVLGVTVGLTTVSVAIAYALLVLVGAAVALRPGERAGPTASPFPPIRVANAHAALFVAAGLIVVAAFAVSIRGAERQDARQQFAELSLVPGADLRLGVRNRSTTGAAYTLRVSSGGHVIRKWSLHLHPGERFAATLPAAAAGSDGMRAVLLNSAGAEVRHVDVSGTTLASY